MDQRIEAFLGDVLALAGEEPVREGAGLGLGTTAAAKRAIIATAKNARCVPGVTLPVLPLVVVV
jgi:hypothetical protein